MQSVVNTFSSRQVMSNEKLEFYHYKDISFGKVQPHMHSHYELYFFLNGDTHYIVGDRQYHLKKGDFLIIEPNTLHFPDMKVASQNQPYERFIIWINPEYLSMLQTTYNPLQEILADIHTGGTCHFRPATEHHQKLLSILEDMMTENTEMEFGHATMIETLFLQLLILIARIISSKKAYQKYKPSQDLYSQLVRYIHANIRENISLDDLASEFYVSRSYISRLFRQHLDMSVHQYILRLKLDRVLAEMKKGKPITEASLEFGFSNYSTFYRQCKKEYGVSPKELIDADIKEDDIFLTDGETF